MAESDVEGALLVAAETFLAANGIATTDVYWPNRDFDPAGKADWAAVYYMPANQQAVSAGSLGLDRETGALLINVSVPRNKGDIVLRAIRDAARAYFITGQTFTQNSQSARVMGCQISPFRDVDNWYRVSLTVVYRAEFTRALIT
jgi:hypothetical protein